MTSRSEGIPTAEEQCETARRQAQAAHAQGDFERAVALYQQCLANKRSPTESLSDAINLGALLRQRGQLSAAAAHYRHWLPLLPQSPTFSLNACNCLRDLGLATESLRVVERCLQAHPAEKALVIGRAECLLDLGRLSESRSVLEGLVSQHPKLRKAWVIFGVVLAKQGQLEAALHAFTQADGLESDEGQMAANRISLLKDLGRLDEAETLWQGLEPEKQQYGAVRGAQAALLFAQNQPERASLLLAQLCREAPQEASHWLNWAACLRSLKYTVAPAAVLKRALQHHPERWELQEALGQSLAEMGATNATERLWHRQSQPSLEDWKDLHIFNRQFLGIASDLVNAQERANQAQAWEQRRFKTGVGLLWPDHLLEPLKGRPLRVGYLTADACNHPVGRFLLPILKYHDKQHVETWVLSCGSHHDWITKQLQKASSHWLNLRAANDLMAARLIADLRLDVVVELGGFTGGSRIGMLIHRPAPIQLSYLGYPGPTYLSCIDGWIGDSMLFGGLNSCDREAHQLLEIPGGYMSFDAGVDIELPARAGNWPFRFGCFNHARKLTDAAIKLFVAVVREVPNAELVLKSISFHETAEKQRIRTRFERAGIEPERLILLDWVEGGLNHLMSYSSIDVALDPIPYGGATTTCEALWMGIPVITLAGDGMAGRLSASVLESAGCGSWIASSNEEYIYKAISLAKAGPRDLSTRLSLRTKVSHSALGDSQRLSQSLEAIYLRQRSRLTGI